MRKPLLLLAVLTMAFTSCTKTSSSNGPWTCTCHYAFQRGFWWVKDTAVSVQYATGTSFTDAKFYCTNTQNQDIADTSKHNAACYVH